MTINPICILRKEAEVLINKHLPINKFIQVPADPFWCNFLIYLCGIYLLISNRKIIYIGLSTNLGPRLNTHFNQYGDEVTSVGIIRLNYKDWYIKASIEAWLISRFNPLYNKRNPYLDYQPIPSDFDLDEITLQIKDLKGKI